MSDAGSLRHALRVTFIREYVDPALQIWSKNQLVSMKASCHSCPNVYST